MKIIMWPWSHSKGHELVDDIIESKTMVLFVRFKTLLVDRVGFALPGGSVVKKLPADAEDVVWSLGWEDPLEKEMATQANILAWRIPWTEEPGGLQSVGSQRVWQDLVTKQQQRLGLWITICQCCS